MNLSGKSVGALARFFKIKPEEVLVVHDELDFEPGQVKLKRAAATAGTMACAISTPSWAALTTGACVWALATPDKRARSQAGCSRSHHRSSGTPFTSRLTAASKPGHCWWRVTWKRPRPRSTPINHHAPSHHASQRLSRPQALRRSPNQAKLKNIAACAVLIRVCSLFIPETLISPA